MHEYLRMAEILLTQKLAIEFFQSKLNDSPIGVIKTSNSVKTKRRICRHYRSTSSGNWWESDNWDCLSN